MPIRQRESPSCRKRRFCESAETALNFVTFRQPTSSSPVGDTDHPSGILIAEVAETAPETRRPLLFGQLIIMTVCLPLRAVSDIEAKMSHPIAIMAVMTLVAAVISSVNFLPAAAPRFIYKEVAEHDNKLVDKGRISTGTFQNGSCTIGRSG